MGKTTTAINLGAAINNFGGDVTIVDGNLTTPNIGLHLNSPEVPINLNQVLIEKAELFEAVYEHQSGMKIVPASLSLTELKNIKPEKLKDLKKDLKKISEYVIVDSSAGLGKEALSAIEIADEVIIVTNPEITAVTDALKTIKVAQGLGKLVRGVIVTRVRKDEIEMQPEAVKDMLEAQIMGMIPEDIAIKQALSMRDAVIHTHPKSKSSRAYKEIAAKILGVEYDSDKDKERLFIRVLKSLGLRN